MNEFIKKIAFALGSNAELNFDLPSNRRVLLARIHDLNTHVAHQKLAAELAEQAKVLFGSDDELSELNEELHRLKIKLLEEEGETQYLQTKVNDLENKLESLTRSTKQVPSRAFKYGDEAYTVFENSSILMVEKLIRAAKTLARAVRTQQEIHRHPPSESTPLSREYDAMLEAGVEKAVATALAEIDRIADLPPAPLPNRA